MAKYKKIYDGKHDEAGRYEAAKPDLFIFPVEGNADAWKAIGAALADLADGTADMPVEGYESPQNFIDRVGKDNLVGKKLPKWVKRVQYVRNDHNAGILVIRLPDMDLMEDARAHSKNGAVATKDYSKPPCFLGFDTVTNREDILKQIFAYYCISHCI